MGTQGKQEKHKFREFIDSWKEKLTSSEYDLVRRGLYIAMPVLMVLIVYDLFRSGGPDWDGIFTEAHGMFMDVLIFGILITWFDQLRRRENQIKNYYDQLKDFKIWSSEEGVLRKVGILGRLNEMGAPLPELSIFQFPKANLNKFKLIEVQLPGANLNNANLFNADLTNCNLTYADFTKADLMEAKLERANLSFANLEEANLMVANLTNADLSDTKLINSKMTGPNLQSATLFNTNLKGADLGGAKNLTCQQLQSAEIDRKTKLPDYIKVTWADDDTYTCEMVEGSD